MLEHFIVLKRYPVKLKGRENFNDRPATMKIFCGGQKAFGKLILHLLLNGMAVKPELKDTFNVSLKSSQPEVKSTFSV